MHLYQSMVDNTSHFPLAGSQVVRAFIFSWHGVVSHRFMLHYGDLCASQCRCQVTMLLKCRAVFEMPCRLRNAVPSSKCRAVSVPPVPAVQVVCQFLPFN